MNDSISQAHIKPAYLPVFFLDFGFAAGLRGCGAVFSIFLTVASNSAFGFSSFGGFFMEHPVVKLKSSLFSQDHLAAIGSVAVESANLEELLDIILDGLLGLNADQRDMVFEGAMMQRKLELVKELGCLKLKSKRRKLELIKIIGDLKHANQERITAIHGIWRNTDRTTLKNTVYGTGKAVATKRGRRNAADSTIQSDKLIGVAERTSEGAQRLAIFVTMAFFRPKVSPPKQPSQPGPT